jgi:hypothetical protein
MTSRQIRWRLDGGGRVLADPAAPHVRLVVLCWACGQAGRERKLAVFGMDTGDGADRTAWVLPFRAPGSAPAAGYSTMTPVARGSGAGARVKLVCGVKAGRGGKNGGGCQNTPDISLAWITAQLGGIWAPGSREIREVFR